MIFTNKTGRVIGLLGYIGLAALLFGGPVKGGEPRDIKTIRDAIWNKSAKPEMAEILIALEAAKPVDINEWSVFWTVFELACQEADREQLSKLVEIFSSTPDDFIKSRSFEPLADCWLRLRVADFVKRPAHYEAVAPSAGLPADDPKALREAELAYLAVAEVMPQASNPSNGKGESVAFQSHEKDYWHLMGEMMKGKGGPFSDRLLAYRWGGTCGFGRDQFFTDPQSTALIIAFLVDGRIAEAGGATLHARGCGPGAVKVLNACVANPLRVLTGGLLVVDRTGKEYGSARQRKILLGLLLQEPGDERAEILQELTKRAPADALADYYQALGKLIGSELQPPRRNYYRINDIGGDPLDMIKPQPITAEAEKKVVAFFVGQMSTQLSVENAQALAEIFSTKDGDGVAGGLRKLLDHPSQTVAKEAAKALEYRGEKVELPPKLGPVRYRILVDGQPYAQAKVFWALLCKIENWTWSSDTTTDADGVAAVPRDYYLKTGAEAVTKVVLRSGPMASPTDASFVVSLPVPPASDEIIPVEVKTVPLKVEVGLPRPALEFAGKMIEVTLSRQNEEGLGFAPYNPTPLKAPVGNEIVFSRLIPGTYWAVIRLEGATRWQGFLKTEDVAVKKIDLQRACDVSFKVRPPEGWLASVFAPTLFRDGKKVEDNFGYEYDRLSGVPEGSYSLHLSSSKEIREHTMMQLPKGNFGATEVPFIVGPDMPMTMDLGEIEVGKK